MKINYPIKWDEQDHLERESKGWLDGIVVTLDDGSIHRVCVYDIARFSQELDDEVESGKSAFVQKGLLIVRSTSKKHIEQALFQAEKEGYFEH
jgi:hypothetical protein